jgi:shikimate dehydrogenase
VTRTGAAVLGAPIAHSLSPVLHQAAYDALGLTEWTYRAMHCVPESLPGVLRELADEGLAGVSLTMPLKRAVTPLLGRIEDAAARIDVVNTVLFGSDEQWTGTNTDIHGIVASLQAAGVSPASGDTVWVIGAGATATSTIAALAQLGVHRAVVAARRPVAGAQLAELAGRLGVDVTVSDWPPLPGCAGAPLVVSTAPAGATDELAVGLGRVSGVLFDVVYAPWPTPLAAAWERGGGQVIGGLDLLVEQAAEQVRLMTGRQPPVAAMRAAGRAALASRPIT